MDSESVTRKRLKAVAKLQRLQSINKNILLQHESLMRLTEHRRLFRKTKSDQYRKAFNDYKKYMRNKKIIDDNIFSMVIVPRAIRTILMKMVPGVILKILIVA